jgi:RNA polymerase sigma-70 factor, ECF subfamily
VNRPQARRALERFLRSAAHLLALAAIECLHHRLTTGDRTVVEDLVRQLMDAVHSRLRRSFRYVPDADVWDATEDAILDYIVRPESFDASRGIALERFIHMAAWRNLANIVAASERRRAREDRHAPPPSCVVTTDPEPPAPQLSLCIVDPAERRAARLWLAGEKRTQPIAAALGMSSLSTGEQRREVKRFKDRLLKRFLRRREELSIAPTSDG